MNCPLKNSCLNCSGKPDFLKCTILIEWFKMQKKPSKKSHTNKIAEESINNRMLPNTRKFIK